MKRFALVFTAMALFAVVQVNAQTIVGSGHDFSGAAWNSTTEICKVCHTPHNGVTTIPGAPLWNHALSTATYTVYTSSTLDATVGQPDGISKLCLSCHDGTIALNNFTGNTYSGADVFASGDALLGTNLTNDHPISFLYDAALATTDGGLFNPTSTNSGLGSTIDADMLFNHKVECASCHDVHNGTGIDFLLLKSNTGSALCLTCHDK
jgi:predicted CXXCH cytochrome family protein